MSNPRDIECRRCNDSGFRVGTYELCPCTTGSNEYAPTPTYTGHDYDGPIGDTLVVAEQTVADVVDAVISLWESQRGWIPGAAYKQLAEALGVSTDRLSHYDIKNHRRVGPPEHRCAGVFSVIDGAESRTGPCGIYVNGVKCGKEVTA